MSTAAHTPRHTGADFAKISDSVLKLSVPDLARQARELLTPGLVAVVAGVKDTRSTREWAEGDKTPAPASQRRLRAAMQCAKMIEAAYGKDTARTWLTGVNVSLGGTSPALHIAASTGNDGAAAAVMAALSFASH